MTTRSLSLILNLRLGFPYGAIITCKSRAGLQTCGGLSARQRDVPKNVPRACCFAIRFGTEVDPAPRSKVLPLVFDW